VKSELKERLQKLIAAAGLASRREAETWIAAGRVSVNGRVASLGDSADPGTDRVEVDGRPLGGEGRKYYLLLNKPVGYVSTRRDPEGRPVVTDLVSEIPARLYPVGRRVRGTISRETLERLEGGVLLEDGMTAPARVDKVRTATSHSWFHLTIREGRNRQVRRMCEAVGFQVSRLKRIRIAFLEIDELPSGKFRHLTPQEVARLKKL
jgi:23S rRNA pseudouridine2605 synthase